MSQFLACRTYNRWSDRESAFQLFTSCQEGALTTLNVNHVDPSKMAYSRIVEVLEQEYGPRECQENYFNALSARKRKPGESLRDLGNDIKLSILDSCISIVTTSSSYMNVLWGELVSLSGPYK